MNATEKDTTYNGWTNYETWCVNLWMDNERGDHDHWRARATELAAELAVTEEMLPYHIGDQIKEEFEESNPVADQASVWGDLMNAALSEVNWSEIAKHLLDEE